MYRPAPTPDQTGLGPEEVKYYPLRLYWEWERYTPRVLSLLLPEAARNYEMAAVDCPSWEPERAVALIGNELHWAVAAEGNKTDYFINSAPLWKSWWASLLEKYLPDYFPEETFPAWLHPSAALLNALKDQKIRRLHWQEELRSPRRCHPAACSGAGTQNHLEEVHGNRRAGHSCGDVRVL